MVRKENVTSELRLRSVRFRREAHSHAEEVFCAKYDHPFLITQPYRFAAVKPESGHKTMGTGNADEIREEARFAYDLSQNRLTEADRDSVIYAVAKGDANAFGMMVTVGREANNDIFLHDQEQRVSKFHASFRRTGDSWSLFYERGSLTKVQLHSSHGWLGWITLGAEAITPNSSEPKSNSFLLSSPANIQFADYPRCEYLSARDLWRKVHNQPITE